MAMSPILPNQGHNITNSLQQGLSLALALHKVHIPCTVYEGRDESYEAGGGITLSPNALRILDKLDVFALSAMVME